MRKYASKLLLDIFLSVVATVSAAYVTHRSFPDSSPAKAPAETTGGSKRVAGAPAAGHVAASDARPDIVNTMTPATVVAGRAIEASDDETAALSPPAKPAKPASLPGWKRPVARDRNILKTNIVATPKPVQVAIVPMPPGRAASERASREVSAVRHGAEGP